MLKVLRYLTAGESHGPQLMAILEGMPAGVPLHKELIDRDLARRQGGYGRGGRMKIERDQIDIHAGVRFGKTLGSPIGLVIANRDWQNWMEKMAVWDDKLAADQELKVTRPRPGHADLAGMIKYGFDDARNVLERASARETAARTAVGGICKALLRELGIEVFAHVVQVGPTCADLSELSTAQIRAQSESSALYCADPIAEKTMCAAIDAARQGGDSLGGRFQVVVTGVPVGLGSHVHWDRKLSTALYAALGGIQAIKAVEQGIGAAAAATPGSQVHDQIYHNGTDYYRKTNRAGGLEGGISNGSDILLTATMKPIPTLYKPLQSVDTQTHQPYEASVERSDVCAVSAAGVVGEAVVAITVADFILQKFGNDSLAQIQRNLATYQSDRQI